MKSDALKLTGKESYLLEKERIQNDIGDLEQIRHTLGLSQRRICQLLLVDPSAWTRWNKTSAPPHIFQALKWLLELRKVQPGVIEPSNLADRLDYFQNSTQNKVKQLEDTVASLEKAIQYKNTSVEAPQNISASEEYINITLLQAQSRLLQKEVDSLKNKVLELTFVKKKKKTSSLKSKKRKVKKKKENQKNNKKKALKKIGRHVSKTKSFKKQKKVTRNKRLQKKKTRSS